MKARSLWVFATTTLAVGLLVPTATSLNRSSETGKTSPVKETKVEVPAELRYAHEPVFQEYFDQFLGRAKHELENIDNLREGPFGVSRIPATKIGSHIIETTGNLGVLYGNGTEPYDPYDWKPKRFGYSSRGLVGQSEMKTLLPYAKQASPYYEAGFRGPLRWRTEIGVIEARPVVITKADCAKCHTDSKPGDMAGIVLARLSPDEMVEFRKATSEAP
ncbi:MAG TPA: hypothetical protein PLB31_03370 [Fimbriimonadaceae bacterium]|nr:hypothetical protein [Armatimonadota bacterium]HCM73647.1 hypothetical protein [Armatimonadota bacterium]HRD31594.1 hypothetical protein [Fimbriimonadaceae bacterium]HRE93326.1 hypothetical protein [Fimbriimonadaceae bacterium]HRI73490.1 hypothetical protein [Fimbriimonadaceae bacterium]